MPDSAAKQPAARLIGAEAEMLLFPGQALSLGRAAENDLVLDDPKVSRVHAVLEWNGSGFTLRDLGSINGTFVNGERLVSASRLLRDGDVILVYRYTFTYAIARVDPVEPLPEALVTGAARLMEARGPRLVIAAGPDQGQEYPIWGEAITIGQASRDATWEIRLNDPAVSRPHARLERRAEGFFLVDLESAAGVELNGERVSAPSPLADGDAISVGETLLIFHAG